MLLFHVPPSSRTRSLSADVSWTRFVDAKFGLFAMSDGLEAAMSSLEAAEREAHAAEKSVREAEERMMRLSKVSASKTIPAPMTATGYRAAANDKEKGDDAHDDDEPKKKEPNDPFTNGYGTTGYGATAKDEEKGDDDDDDEPKEKKEPNDPFADGFGPYLSHSLDELFNPWKSPMNWLLLCHNQAASKA